MFETEVLRVQRAIKTRLSRYIRGANPLIVLTAPVIYSLIVPVALLEVIQYRRALAFEH